MNAWILHADVVEVKKGDYWYELDRALETLKTIFWGQSKPITNIDVDDIVYIYANKPVGKITWKCRVLAVKVPPQNADIDDSEFGHGNGDTSDYYIKITALAKYYDAARAELSLEKLRQNGLTQERGPHRINQQLWDYINSI